MSTEDAKKIVPESTKAVIALLKEGMVKKSVMLTLIRVVLLSGAIIFAVGRASEYISIKMTATQMNILDKLNTLIVAVHDVSTKEDATSERVLNLEYFTGMKKLKQ